VLRDVDTRMDLWYPGAFRRPRHQWRSSNV